MNTEQLLDCLSQDKTLSGYSYGVYAANRLPKNHDIPACIIVNTDPATKPGSHWIALYIASDGVEYFDSFGRFPRKDFNNYLKDYSKNIQHNGVRIQGPLSNSCGQYCVYYLCQRTRGRSMKNIIADFSKDYILNDTCVAAFVRQTFLVDSKPYDVKFIVSQISK
jgi:hypothetical protein